MEIDTLSNKSFENTIPLSPFLGRFVLLDVLLVERDRLEFCFCFRSSSCSITACSVIICPLGRLSTVRFVGLIDGSFVEGVNTACNASVIALSDCCVLDVDKLDGVSSYEKRLYQEITMHLCILPSPSDKSKSTMLMDVLFFLFCRDGLDKL